MEDIWRHSRDAFTYVNMICELFAIAHRRFSIYLSDKVMWLGADKPCKRQIQCVLQLLKKLKNKQQFGKHLLETLFIFLKTEKLLAVLE